MSGEAIVRVVGNLGGDPELRFTPSGKAVCNFSLANTPRVKGANGEWEDGETLWLRVAVWGNMAEAVVENAHKGTKVLVVGRLTQRSYQTDAGETRTSIDVTADEVGIVPRWQSPQGQGQHRAPAQGQRDPWAPPADDAPPF